MPVVVSLRLLIVPCSRVPDRDELRDHIQGSVARGPVPGPVRNCACGTPPGSPAGSGMSTSKSWQSHGGRGPKVMLDTTRMGSGASTQGPRRTWWTEEEE